MSNVAPVISASSGVRPKILTPPICTEFVQRRDKSGKPISTETTRKIEEVNKTTQITEQVPDVYLLRINTGKWHGLGTTLETQPSIEQIHNFMDTQIELKTESVYTASGLQVPEHTAVSWNGTCLGTIGQRTEIYQNRRFVHSLQIWEEHPFRSIGYLDAGRIIFATIEIPCPHLEIRKHLPPMQLTVVQQHGHTNNLSHQKSFSLAFPGNQSILGYADPKVRQMEKLLSSRHSPTQGEEPENFDEILQSLITATQQNAKVIASLDKKMVEKKHLFELYRRIYETDAKTPEALNRRSKNSYLQLENAFNDEGGKTMLDLYLASCYLWTTALNDMSESKWDRAGRQMKKLLSSAHNIGADQRLQFCLAL